MKKELKILSAITFVVLVGVVVAIGLYKNANPPNSSTNQSISTQPSPSETTASSDAAKQSETPEAPKLVRSESYSLGPAMARVSIVEFLDPECESCKAFFPIMKRVLKDYDGRVNFVVRYMAFHKSSAMAIAATEAAGLQAKYWEMQELLFEKAEEWGHRDTPDESFFIKYAGALGLDIERFKNDLVDPRWPEKLEQDMEDGKVLGVRGTPTIFINGNKLQDLSYEALALEIDKNFAE